VINSHVPCQLGDTGWNMRDINHFWAYEADMVPLRHRTVAPQGVEPCSRG